MEIQDAAAAARIQRRREAVQVRHLLQEWKLFKRESDQALNEDHETRYSLDGAPGNADNSSSTHLSRIDPNDILWQRAEECINNAKSRYDGKRNHRREMVETHNSDDQESEESSSTQGYEDGDFPVYRPSDLVESDSESLSSWKSARHFQEQLKAARTANAGSLSPESIRSWSTITPPNEQTTDKSTLDEQEEGRLEPVQALVGRVGSFITSVWQNSSLRSTLSQLGETVIVSLVLILGLYFCYHLLIWIYRVGFSTVLAIFEPVQNSIRIASRSWLWYPASLFSSSSLETAGPRGYTNSIDGGLMPHKAFAHDLGTAVKQLLEISLFNDDLQFVKGFYQYTPKKWIYMSMSIAASSLPLKCEFAVSFDKLYNNLTLCTEQLSDLHVLTGSVVLSQSIMQLETTFYELETLEEGLKDSHHATTASQQQAITKSSAVLTKLTSALDASLSVLDKNFAAIETSFQYISQEITTLEHLYSQISHPSLNDKKPLLHNSFPACTEDWAPARAAAQRTYELNSGPPQPGQDCLQKSQLTSHRALLRRINAATVHLYSKLSRAQLAATKAHESVARLSRTLATVAGEGDHMLQMPYVAVLAYLEALVAAFPPLMEALDARHREGADATWRGVVAMTARYGECEGQVGDDERWEECMWGPLWLPVDG